VVAAAPLRAVAPDVTGEIAPTTKSALRIIIRDVFMVFDIGLLQKRVLVLTTLMKRAVNSTVLFLTFLSVAHMPEVPKVAPNAS
jgi:hypothetical protein